MHILGISAFYHDSAAALVRDGQLIAAAQEERFTRKKHDDRFPIHAVKYCLREGGISVGDLDAVVFYDKPFVKFERLLFTYLEQFPRGLKSFMWAMPIWMRDKLWIKSIIHHELGYDGEIYFNDHHLSHAASAFLVSPFREAAILTVDGVGEWSTSTWGVGRDTQIELWYETRFPHSLGLFYSAFTYYLGFKVNSAEYKVMGLAPYGQPTYYDKVRETIEWKPDGSFRLNTEYFDFLHGLRMTNERFHRLFGGPPRQPETRLTQREFDIAASVQKVTDEIMVALGRHIRKETGMRYLCMAGGVALNCVANAKVLEQTEFEDVWVQPAAGDAGGALGAAFYFWNSVCGKPRTFRMDHALWGPQYSEEECRSYLDSMQARYRRLEPQELVKEVARLIAQGDVVGWFQGRMEFGPRALGSRSILADARDPKMKDTLNMKIKFREGFRPFAPSVTQEAANEFFEMNKLKASPFMLFVANVRADKRVIPSVTHVDGSARLQTVERDLNPLYHELISEFGRQTGVPVIINTSFNVRGEPIVCTPADAYRCFMRTNMDHLVVGPFLMDKKEQPPWQESGDWRKEFALD
ncbi:Nodulation protein nolO [Candidatus Sumerlaea chitinivorans]|uniref:Nodulation protein nolO n=1 Tax=Sumerlaea chitinivorans TaxID=2250252 RepID=A0A2Z4Y7H3_SUMC1|nr:Nodulation protein nolO [Candidatus Sumerlaea chitinivorans]